MKFINILIYTILSLIAIPIIEKAGLLLGGSIVLVVFIIFWKVLP